MGRPLNPGRKPIPKLPDGNIDREKVKELYINGAEYDFVEFLTKHHFSHIYKNSGHFPIRVWKEEWIRTRLERQNDSIIPDAIAVRQSLGQARLSYVKNWQTMAHNARQLLMYIMANHASQIHHDQKFSDEISQGSRKAKFNLNTYAAMQLGSALKFIQEVELKALLVPNVDIEKAMVPLPTLSVDERSAEAEGDELRNMPINIIGMKVPAEKVTGELAKWFDQFQRGDNQVRDQQEEQDLEDAED